MDDHFNSISGQYDKEIPEHIRLHLLKKKTSLTIHELQKVAPRSKMGLDAGCGTGHYLARMIDMGYDMQGFDYSLGMVEQALKNTDGKKATVKVGSILEIPYPNASFDFAYSINVIHHLFSKDEQMKALEEIHRILKPGGVFFIHEMNTDNCLFRFYMNHIFPLTNCIDHDNESELWVAVSWLRGLQMPGFKIGRIIYYTYIPNFLPRLAFGFFKGIEYVAEQITLGMFGAHYMATFIKS